MLRIKNHTRTMPFLLPPPEFKRNELADMGLTGTCELQICRSAGLWSIDVGAFRLHRDSEIAAIIRGTDMIDSTLAGQPYSVGRFAHSLHVRLMREHIGVDADSRYENDLMASDLVKPSLEQEEWDPDQQQEHGKEDGVTHERWTQMDR
ncbi:hypothetical protein CERSUDRAFT_127785 [Gelatoporia subvermispora B]|uniref:Uncharacterized protein n=1 Tax=Ceriporiopsis subvermispora (strain B) TaxID=914234 RepID=M2P5Q3_CERS8|nr:hypothetical protein CERSUDRAFT_127785 [Gelatoporia subvermispora B]